MVLIYCKFYGFFLIVCFVLTSHAFKNILKTPEKKSWNHGFAPCPPSWNKTRNMQFQDAVSANIKEDFLLHPTTPHPTMIKALENTKMKKRPSASLPIDF